jgi:transposase InsO family protein
MFWCAGFIILARPNEKWLTDVTEMKYGASQKAYLSAILDLHDGSIVSYVLGTSNNNPLVFKTLDLALKPTREPLHSSTVIGDFNTPPLHLKGKLRKQKWCKVCREWECASIMDQWKHFGEH